MSVVQVQAQLPTDELLKAVGQLSQPELERFVSQILALRAQRQAPTVSQREAELLQTINQGVPAEIQQRYDELIAKRRAETLTSEEYKELLHLTSEIERLAVKRLEYLAELARIRQTSLRDLMAQLGIPAPTYA